MSQEKDAGLYYATCTCGWSRLGYWLAAVTDAAAVHAAEMFDSARSHRIVVSR